MSEKHRPFKRYALCLIALFLIAMSPALMGFQSNDSTCVIIIDRQQVADTFEGIGAVSAGASSRLLIDYPEPQRSQILDLLFTPKYGAAFQHLKVEIGSDINSTDGTEPSHIRVRGQANFNRGYEWWLMREAKKRNPRIMLDALAWGAPGWIGEGNFWSQDAADYFVSFLKGAKSVHDLDIHHIGIWNERDYDVEWIKLFRKTLDRNNLKHVNLVAADLNGDPQRLWRIARDMVADPELKSAVYAIGVHYPWGEVAPAAYDLKREGKRLWSSEDGEWHWPTMQPFTHLRAQKCNLNYVERKLTKTEFWSPITAYYDNLPAPNSGVIKANTPWSGAFQILPTLYAVAHTTQFTEPGWFYLKDAGAKLPQGGSVVALTSPDHQELTIVIETTEARRDQEVQIRLTDAGISRLYVWYSGELEQFVRQEPLHSVAGIFKVLVKPNAILTLTTTTGQQKPSVSSPVAKAFPLPYQDDFETYPLEKTPKYLCDQGGAFEVSQKQSGGKCLTQQICRRGIDWAATAYPYAIIGDMNWNDIDVSVDICLEIDSNTVTPPANLYASVIARSYPGATWLHFSTPHPMGYNFTLFATGHWELTSATKVIAQGESAPLRGWQTLRLMCRQNRLEAFIGATRVTAIQDDTYKNGMAGIGCSFHPVHFDNFTITDAYLP